MTGWGKYGVNWDELRLACPTLVINELGDAIRERCLGNYDNWGRLVELSNSSIIDRARSMDIWLQQLIIRFLRTADPYPQNWTSAAIYDYLGEDRLAINDIIYGNEKLTPRSFADWALQFRRVLNLLNDTWEGYYIKDYYSDGTPNYQANSGMLAPQWSYWVKPGFQPVTNYYSYSDWPAVLDLWNNTAWQDTGLAAGVMGIWSALWLFYIECHIYPLGESCQYRIRFDLLNRIRWAMPLYTLSPFSNYPQKSVPAKLVFLAQGNPGGVWGGDLNFRGVEQFDAKDKTNVEAWAGNLPLNGDCITFDYHERLNPSLFAPYVEPSYDSYYAHGFYNFPAFPRLIIDWQLEFKAE